MRGETAAYTYHTHPTDVSIVRACLSEKGFDLLAVGGDTWVEILQRDKNSDGPSFSVIATFHTGTQSTAVGWSPRTVSPAQSDEWFIELAVAGEDGHLRLLTKSAKSDADVFTFGGGLSGHAKHARINGICFCVAGDYYSKFMATVADDKLCIIWDLHPPEPEKDFLDSATPSPSQSPSSSRSPAPRSPTAYPIPFTHPLHTVASHPNNARSFMVSDSCGTVSVINWTELEQDPGQLESWRQHRVAELVDPKALGEGLTNLSGLWGGGAGWKPSDVNIFGATYGSRWVVWNLKSLQGGKPVMSGEGHAEGGHRFRWCPTNPHLFGISTQSPLRGAVIKVFHTSFPHAPRSYQILPRPHRVRDFDWIGPQVNDELAGTNQPCWMAAAIGRNVYFTAGGDTLD